MLRLVRADHLYANGAVLLVVGDGQAAKVDVAPVRTDDEVPLLPTLARQQLLVVHTVQAERLDDAPIALHILQRLLGSLLVQVVVAGGHEADAFALRCG